MIYFLVLIIEFLVVHFLANSNGSKNCLSLMKVVIIEDGFVTHPPFHNLNFSRNNQPLVVSRLRLLNLKNNVKIDFMLEISNLAYILCKKRLNLLIHVT